MMTQGAAGGVPLAVVPSGNSAGGASFQDVLETQALRPGAPLGQTAERAPTPTSPCAADAAPVDAAKVLDQVSAAQRRLDSVLAMAQSGKAFTPAELLALQAQVYRASQELDLAGKVVEKATAGVKQVLQTQV